MLEQISYVHDCDTFGEGPDRSAINELLVTIYQSILEFYGVAHDVLVKKNIRLTFKMSRENSNLSKIVDTFIGRVNNLQKLVQNATLRDVEAIKSMAIDEQIDIWLGGADKSTHHTSLHASFKTVRTNKACNFLLAQAEFIKWYENAGAERQLLFVGDIGTGKTITMSFLIDELRQNSGSQLLQLPRPIVCHHYCRDGTTGHINYILIVITMQLLKNRPRLKILFHKWCTEHHNDLNPAADYVKLAQFLRTAVRSLDRPLYIVIDGLDECDKKSLKFLYTLLGDMLQETPTLKIALSSRPEPCILKRFKTSLRVDIVTSLERDRFIVERTFENLLDDEFEGVRKVVVTTLARLANGSAIWTSMVIGLIGKRHIKGVKQMELFLSHDIPLPNDLYEFYHGLIKHLSAGDDENRHLIEAALKVLAVARRYLSIHELSCAVNLATSADEITSVSQTSGDDMRILDLIYLIILPYDDTDLDKRQIRLVHQSVKEFVLEFMFRALHSGNSQAMRTPQQLRFAEATQTLEASMRDLCVRYLLLDEIGLIKGVLDEEEGGITTTFQELGLMAEGYTSYDEKSSADLPPEELEKYHHLYNPAARGFGEFFVYASCNWLYHFGAVEATPWPNLRHILTLCQPGSTLRLNWTEQHIRPDCAIRPQFLLPHKPDALDATAWWGSESMLQYFLDNSDLKDSTYFHPETFPIILGACHVSRHTRIKILFNHNKTGPKLQNLEFFETLVEEYSHDQQKSFHHWDEVFSLVDCMTEVMIQEHWANELLCIAAGDGCMPLVRRLMIKAQSVPHLKNELLSTPDRGNRFQSIGEAVITQQADVLAFLLEQDGIEAHLQHRPNNLSNPLHLATGDCKPSILKILLPRCKDMVNDLDYANMTPLDRTRHFHYPPLQGESCECISILLSYGAVYSHS
ncbi:hypothetical protein K461DRAFT_162459 [Myriangium duriaei CBS 260.36]|uniref:NACHT domain-containing protein n=1 Tax=Myriangium duriaei CBS 260.36 TaxID=1168546 RepID=A0A9P4IYA1_9PEZI|nr:hypothetical protein K461DRAFT_162459 [Myriangium duriaei CBS 260.36]